MLESGHSSFGQRLPSLEGATQSFDKLTEAEGQEEGPEE